MRCVQTLIRCFYDVSIEFLVGKPSYTHCLCKWQLLKEGMQRTGFFFRSYNEIGLF